MSPEYTVVADKKTGRYEIKASLLPGEDKDGARDALLIPVIANSFIKRNEIGRAVNKLEEILPKATSEHIVQAVKECREGYKVKLEKQKNGKYEIIRDEKTKP